MGNGLGKQYNKDDKNDPSGFLKNARLHQSKYRDKVLRVTSDGYGNYLTKQDALKGLNFYNDFGVFNAVNIRYGNKYSKALYANMLRSEHIPFNFFIPLKTDLEYCKNVFNRYLGNYIKSINRIEIEYAPTKPSQYLNDKTSFDTYIEYTHIDNSDGIIGIEVKYTERDYKLKRICKERDDITVDYNKSKYKSVMEKCEIYKNGTLPLLITDKFRQIWRNQLLGESILITDNDKFKHFTSLTLFPKQNIHFINASKEYINLMAHNNYKFLPVTYEDFISICDQYCPNDKFKKWLDYLLERYIVTS